MKAKPRFDVSVQKWIVEVESNGEILPMGNRTSNILDTWELCKWESKEDAIHDIKEMGLELIED